MNETIYSLDEEEYKYNDIQEAINSAYEDALIEKDEVVEVWSGTARKPLASDFCTYLVDGLRERAYDEHGEFSEGWLDGAGKENLDELEQGVKAVIDKWAERNNCQPSFFSINNPERLSVLFISEDEYEIISDGSAPGEQ